MNGMKGGGLGVLHTIGGDVDLKPGSVFPNGSVQIGLPMSRERVNVIQLRRNVVERSAERGLAGMGQAGGRVATGLEGCGGGRNAVGMNEKIEIGLMAEREIVAEIGSEAESLECGGEDAMVAEAGVKAVKFFEHVAETVGIFGAAAFEREE